MIIALRSAVFAPIAVPSPPVIGTPVVLASPGSRPSGKSLVLSGAPSRIGPVLLVGIPNSFVS
uniref:Photosystem II reaction center protein Z n=1 Tax=Selaginella remotifolia TaxID=137170 RepID=A0A482CHU6_SELRE|nr:photosystem II protein Z [Selaginella remotifolia]QBL76253.1 photosystem II protein Z [Selaginella remotifolia]